MTVWLARAVLNGMNKEAATIYPLETGGILLGWRSGDESVLIDMRGPGHSALHGRERFFPDHPWQLSEIRQVFQKSGGDLDYMGDWHSHPDGLAEMSGQDVCTLRRICRRVGDALTVIIAESGDQTQQIGCWRGLYQRSYFVRRFEVVEERVKIFDPPGEWSAIAAISSQILQ